MSFTLPELRSLLAVANDEWKSLILFGLYTGQRLGDLARLTWQNVDLEHDGFPEVIHAGGQCRVAAVHYSGSPRSGYPVAARDSLAPADSTAFWPPLIADVDQDGTLDVIPILPDGTRPAFRADGSRIAGFGELGSTGMGSPPMLIDLDNDGTLEWVETLDQVPSNPEIEIDVRTTTVPSSRVA